MAELLHFEDFAVGQVIDLGSYAVTAAEIREFANEFDPQPFHLDGPRAALRCLAVWQPAAGTSVPF
jgi:acyl dehydratase